MLAPRRWVTPEDLQTGFGNMPVRADWGSYYTLPAWRRRPQQPPTPERPLLPFLQSGC